MKNVTHIFLFFAMILITPIALKAQNDSIRKAEFTASINYQSRLNYFGRTDSLKSSGMYPSIGYQFKCGLYAQGNFIFAHNSVQPYTYAGSTIEAGYRFPQGKKITGNFFVITTALWCSLPCNINPESTLHLTTKSLTSIPVLI